MSDILLVGVGLMALDYAKVLTGMKRDFIAIGRGSASAEVFKEKTSIEPFVGGLDKYLSEFKGKITDTAIVSVGVEGLASTAISLMNHGVTRILLEKPGGLNVEEISQVVRKADDCGAKVFIAYNRRFYSSVIEGVKLMKQDGGVKSFHFEFTEWAHEIETLDKPKSVMNNWFLANSTHVVDMAFFMGGFPKEIKSFSRGGVAWHPASSIYTGAGVSDQGALFSYCANWTSPGRWAVEMLTDNYRFIYKPLEKLQIQKKGSVAVEGYDIDDQLDQTYKPGLFKQVEAFLEEEESSLCTIDEHYGHMSLYNDIANYN